MINRGTAHLYYLQIPDGFRAAGYESIIIAKQNV